jgi:integrase
MRMSEQYGPRWNQVDFERRQVHLDQTKNGGPRTIPLNPVALSTLKQMGGEKNRSGTELVFYSARTADPLQGSRG